MKTMIVLGAMGAVALGLRAPSPALAQIPDATVAASEKVPVMPSLDPNETYRFIPVRNVPAELMAWWLDPKNQPMPQILVENQRLSEMFVRRPKTVQPNAPTIPPKTESNRNSAFPMKSPVRGLVPLQQPRGLLVAATDESLFEIRKIVEFLDQPARRVQVEATLARVSKEDLEQLGVQDFATRNPALPVSQWSVAFLRAKSMENAQRLKARNDVHTKTFAPTVMWNNLTAQLSEKEPNSLNASSGKTQLVVTPTVNSDATITLVMQWGEEISFDDAHKSALLQTVANLRDGDTLIVQVPSAKTQQNPETWDIALITARTLEPIAMPDDAK